MVADGQSDDAGDPDARGHGSRPASGEPAKRDAGTGRFLPGNSGGPGRPRGLDFRRVIADRAEAAGIPLETALWGIFTSLLKQARDGDVQAARLLLDRLCDNDPVSLRLAEASIALRVVTNVDEPLVTDPDDPEGGGAPGRPCPGERP